MAKSKGKGAISTPFGSSEGKPYPSVPSHRGTGNPGTYDHNRTAAFSQKRDVGPDAMTTKFYESGKALEPNPEKFETPFGNTLNVKSVKKGTT